MLTHDVSTNSRYGTACETFSTLSLENNSSGKRLSSHAIVETQSYGSLDHLQRMKGYLADRGLSMDGILALIKAVNRNDNCSRTIARKWGWFKRASKIFVVAG